MNLVMIGYGYVGLSFGVDVYVNVPVTSPADALHEYAIELSS